MAVTVTKYLGLVKAGRGGARMQSRLAQSVIRKKNVF